MTKTILATILLVFLSVSSVVAQKIDTPTLTPTPLTDSQRQLMKEGIALHDRGDYDGAIAKYEEVLRENPDNDSTGKSENEINIFVETGGKKDEGDFDSLQFALGITKAAEFTEKDKKKSEVEQLVDRLDTQLSIVAEMEAKEDKSKFTWRYYIPYFVELKKRNYVEPFTYYISQSSEMNGVAEWLQANSGRVNEFLAWSKSYLWAKEK